jgi:hypothetical protein
MSRRLADASTINLGFSAQFSARSGLMGSTVGCRAEVCRSSASCVTWRLYRCINNQ